MEKHRLSTYPKKEILEPKIQDFKNLFQKQYKHRFKVKVDNHFSTFNVKDITFFKSENGTICLNTFNGKGYPIEYTIDQLNEILNPIDFLESTENK
ncbi:MULTISPECIES: hypothetical protein [Flavobacterium]|uniref:Uncharacterized protein n=1 Tax=Flavobacterium jumunjinense TaxID=998845 RepID=A0ABV5GLZ7_9FLAO|nr:MULTISPECIES: hypothetical protein [Flavobacterium]